MENFCIYVIITLLCHTILAGEGIHNTGEEEGQVYTLDNLPNNTVYVYINKTVMVHKLIAYTTALSILIFPTWTNDFVQLNKNRFAAITSCFES